MTQNGEIDHNTIDGIKNYMWPKNAAPDRAGKILVESSTNKHVWHFSGTEEARKESVKWWVGEGVTMSSKTKVMEVSANPPQRPPPKNKQQKTRVCVYMCLPASQLYPTRSRESFNEKPKVFGEIEAQLLRLWLFIKLSKEYK